MKKQSKALFTLASLAIVMSMLLAACSGATPAPATQAAPTQAPATEVPKEKPTIVIALDSDIDHIEPMQFRSLGAYHATANLYEPLVMQKLVPDDKGNLIGQNTFEGAGAETYEVSPDGMTFTFHLRKNAKFADGTPITANDYRYTFERAMKGPGYIGLLTGFFALESMDQIKVVDDYTLQLTTKRPSALTEVVLSFQVLGAMSEATGKAHATEKDPYADEWTHTNANPSGPYIITEWKPGVQYTFEPNPNYWRGPDYFGSKKIVFRVVPDASTREQLLRSGDVDIALGIPFKDLAELKKDANIEIHAVPTTRVYHVGMNVKKKPFDDVRVRQAVSMVVPYDAIVQNVIYGFGKNPKSPVGDGMPTHDESFFTFDKKTVDDAKKLLADAGYPDGFEVELTVPQEDQARVDSATWVQSGLEKIGVKVKVNALPTAQYSDLLNSHELPMYIFEWFSWGNDPFFQFTWNFKCEAFTNFANYCNPELDKIIDQGIYTRDEAEREKLSKQAQEMIVNDAVWIYLYQPDWVVATRKGVSGIALFNDLNLHFAYLQKK